MNDFLMVATDRTNARSILVMKDGKYICWFQNICRIISKVAHFAVCKNHEITQGDVVVIPKCVNMMCKYMIKHDSKVLVKGDRLILQFLKI